MIRAAAMSFVVMTLGLTVPLLAADGPAQVLPHHQTVPPNDPLTPAQAAARMTVPEGFTVEVVASEPDLVNPVAMTFDERGRIWVTESLEYPRRSAGPGRDRVKVLEDTDADGKVDRVTVFAEGLNIPSGIAVGHGGVWVANSPDILFLQDTDGDGKADRSEVVVTGFGRSDTHELPNTLNWGPDGWLYGWNGVFNPSRVTYRGKTHEFTCAIFRIHPRTRDFEIFCEGTSNPWGIAWDNEGSAFASACVIDHLWHLVETGYYHRQGGPYPPFTWKLESIVDHKHQMAAYCGIHFYDSDAYPEAYRGKLFMGNIHGNCVNLDRIERRGATYHAASEADFLTSHDAWFMPVAQKTGPDGCLYILDWYDRYHCYQDANRDPQGIDRLKGRLYRVRYQETPRRSGFDLARLSDDALIQRLGGGNSYDRDLARRLLAERSSESTDARLHSLALDSSQPRKLRMDALWAAISREKVANAFLLGLMSDADPAFRAWGVRAAGNARKVDPKVAARIAELASDADARVTLQVAVASRKVEGLDPVDLLCDVADHAGQDSLVPHIVWQNVYPLLDAKEPAGRFIERAVAGTAQGNLGWLELSRLAVDRLLARSRPEEVNVASLVLALLKVDSEPGRAAARQAIRSVIARIPARRVSTDIKDALREQFRDVITQLGVNRATAASARELRWEGTLLGAAWGEPGPLESLQKAVESGRFEAALNDDERVRGYETLLAATGPALLDGVLKRVSDRSAGALAFRERLLGSLGRLDDPRLAGSLLALYPGLEPSLQNRAVDLLTQRSVWARTLLDAIGRGVLPPTVLNINQIRKLQSGKDQELARLVREKWGTVREGRNPGRDQVIAQMRELLVKTPGDPRAGAEVFKKLCAQCHKIYGEGQEVGPEITANGRASLDQLLSNVFDPSLVIGASYQGTTVATKDGRILNGLVVEDNPQRLVLKLQGGKLETIARSDVDEVKRSELSLMPEDVEKQLQPREIADLFAYITLDRPPHDSAAKPIPGAEGLPRTPAGR